MILAFDTFYKEHTATTVAIAFDHWQAETPLNVYEETLNGVDVYIPGQFYKRELPCILSLLQQIDYASCEAIIVDGYVQLDDTGSKGLGAHLYDALNGKIPIIGVAKNKFSGIQTLQEAVFRGSSNKALHITSMGIDLARAANHIREMHGNFRFPTLLKLVDALGRKTTTL